MIVEIPDLLQKLLDSEKDRIIGAKTYSIKEVSEKLKGLIEMVE